MKIINKASSKIRELRELIENLSKKLCISENSEGIKFGKLNKTIKKLKYENKRLFEDNKQLEIQFSPSVDRQQTTYNNYTISKAPSSKHNTFLLKHKLRPSSHKSLKNSHKYSKSSVFQSSTQQIQNPQKSMKNLKILKDRLHSPHERHNRSNNPQNLKFRQRK